MTRLHSFAFALALAASAAHAETPTVHYIGKARLDATVFLAPPPAPDSPRQVADLATVKAYQAQKDQPRWLQAQSDDQLSPFIAFSSVLGPDFTAEKAPRLAAVFEALFADVKTVTAPAKVAFVRPRPPLVDTTIETCRPLEQSGSYPSGHASRGWMMALVLSEMVPEKTNEILGRGRDYGESRIVCAEHFPSDVEAGRLIGAAVFNTARLNPKFRRDQKRARAELRRALKHS
jgi:acid phosphatase (class A)